MIEQLTEQQVRQLATGFRRKHRNAFSSYEIDQESILNVIENVIADTEMVLREEIPIDAFSEGWWESEAGLRWRADRMAHGLL